MELTRNEAPARKRARTMLAQYAEAEFLLRHIRLSCAVHSFFKKIAGESANKCFVSSPLPHFLTEE